MPDEPPTSDWNAFSPLVSPYWSPGEVLSRLDINRERLNELVASNDLLPVSAADGATLYPGFQFVQNDGVIRIRAVASTCFRILGGLDVWTVAMLFNLPAAELDELTPASWMREGLPDEPLITWAMRIDGEWRSGNEPGQHPRRRRRLYRQQPLIPTDAPTALNAFSAGTWLITTEASRHVLDIEQGIIARVPGDEAPDTYDYDTEFIEYSRIEWWPRIGSPALIWFHEPDSHTGSAEHWRILSEVTGLEELTPGHPLQPRRLGSLTNRLLRPN